MDNSGATNVVPFLFCPNNSVMRGGVNKKGSPFGTSLKIERASFAGKPFLRWRFRITITYPMAIRGNVAARTTSKGIPSAAHASAMFSKEVPRI